MPLQFPDEKILSNVGPGGRLFTNYNAVNQAGLANRKQEIENQFAPITNTADAASKLAYANLMGPQFMAKMLGNPAITANMTEDQKRAGLQRAVSPVVGTNAFNIQSLLPTSGQGNGGLINFIKNLFPAQTTTPQQATTPTNQPPNTPVQNPGQTDTTPRNGANSGYAYDAKGKNIVASPQEVKAVADQTTKRTWPENIADQQGIIKEGEKRGEIRGQAIGDLGEQYQQILQSEAPVDHLIELSQNDELRKIKDSIPYFQDQQLKLLSKSGSDKQQRVIGDFVTTAQSAVANTVNSFRGKILDKEITMANKMKISDNDTWHTMLGKLSSIKTFQEMLKQRNRIATKLMKNNHMDLGDALEEADKSIDGKEIRNKVEAMLNPKPDEDDINYMADKYKVSPDEIRKRLKAKGKL